MGLIMILWTIILMFQGALSTQQSESSSSIPVVSIWSVLVFIGGVILNLGGAWVLLKSATVRENLKQTQDLAKVYKDSYEKEKKEREELELKLKSTKEQCSTFEASYTALAGIAVKELLNFSQLIEERNVFEARCKKLAEENLDLKLREKR